MSRDRASTENLNQKQASGRLTNETEKQINPSVKFNPRQETGERLNQEERDTKRKTSDDVVATHEHMAQGQGEFMKPERADLDSNEKSGAL